MIHSLFKHKTFFFSFFSTFLLFFIDVINKISNNIYFIYIAILVIIFLSNSLYSYNIRKFLLNLRLDVKNKKRNFYSLSMNFFRHRYVMNYESIRYSNVQLKFIHIWSRTSIDVSLWNYVTVNFRATSLNSLTLYSFDTFTRNVWRKFLLYYLHTISHIR